MILSAGTCLRKVSAGISGEVNGNWVLEGLSQNEGADGHDQGEQDKCREETAREEAESHRDEQRAAEKRSIFGQSEKARIGAVMLGIVHLRAQFDRTGRRVISHRNTPSKTSFRHIAKSRAESNGAIAALGPTTASREN
ncbi:mll5182 [Mesorhizobium japonicum MAFF 303099]|uniref:Mll5182 protein n=1 Tax=Mesorhizobium japonicum (strain LMG 29417 / CECT 9101 / MAFF 303099) TaxID=266835 RepID=Q98CE7_RHILO|nr:mll5182 [Mesorhizobium japonicum MAFF 303099]